MSEWKDVGREGDVSIWKPEEGEVLEGVLTLISKEVGKNKSTLYEITTEEDEKVAVWETSVLKSKFDRVPLNSTVRLTYLGKRKSANGPASYHDFKVQVKEETPTEEEALFAE